MNIGIDIGKLMAPRVNVRRKMDEGKLAELKRSIRERGILQNLLVLREPGDAEMYRVVAGARRHRAVAEVVAELGRDLDAAEVASDCCSELRARLESLSLVPCRVLTEEEAMEAEFLQVVENLHREEVALVDEVWMVGQFLARGMSQAELAGKLTVDRMWVHRRSLLLRAPENLMAALESGVVSVKAAVAVCVLPGAAERAELAARVLHPVGSVRPLDETETRRIIESEYMLPLADAPWRLTEQGVADRIPCEGCEHLTRRRGAGDACLSRECYGAKAKAKFEARARDDWHGRGYLIMRHEDAAEVFTGADGAVDPAGEWIDLDEQVPYRDLGHFGDCPWRTFLGEKLEGAVEEAAQVWVAFHPARFTVRFLASKSALRLLLRSVLAPKVAAPWQEVDAGAAEEDADDDGDGGADRTADGGSVGTRRRTLDADMAAAFRDLVARGAEAGLEALLHARLVRGLALLRLRELDGAGARRWAEVCGMDVSAEGADPRAELEAALARVHPDLLAGWWLAGLALGAHEADVLDLGALVTTTTAIREGLAS